MAPGRLAGCTNYTNYVDMDAIVYDNVYQPQAPLHLDWMLLTTVTTSLRATASPSPSCWFGGRA